MRTPIDIRVNEINSNIYGTPVDGVFKWITFQEILFLFISCSVLAFLLRSRDTLQFKLVLNVSTEERVARENLCQSEIPS